jgi:hypothetical protein
MAVAGDDPRVKVAITTSLAIPRLIIHPTLVLIPTVYGHL